MYSYGFYGTHSVKILKIQFRYSANHRICSSGPLNWWLRRRAVLTSWLAWGRVGRHPWRSPRCRHRLSALNSGHSSALLMSFSYNTWSKWWSRSLAQLTDCSECLWAQCSWPLVSLWYRTATTAGMESLSSASSSLVRYLFCDCKHLFSKSNAFYRSFILRSQLVPTLGL